jgi:hypothetical protein
MIGEPESEQVRSEDICCCVGYGLVYYLGEFIIDYGLNFGYTISFSTIDNYKKAEYQLL